MGDAITFNGVEFTINNIITGFNEYEYSFHVPYGVNLGIDNVLDYEDAQDKIGEIVPNLEFHNISISNLNRKMTDTEQLRLREVGIEASHFPMFNIAGLWVIIVLLILLGVNIVNIMLNVAYWLKANDRKYAVMKITGAKPSTIASAMIFESLLMVVLGSLVGIAVEHYMSAAFLQLFIERFLWIHYLIMVPIVIFAALIPIVIKVVKRVKSCALDRKIYS